MGLGEISSGARRSDAELSGERKLKNKVLIFDLLYSKVSTALPVNNFVVCFGYSPTSHYLLSYESFIILI